MHSHNGAQEVTMKEAYEILTRWFGEHDGHDTLAHPENGEVGMWCEDCRHLRTLKVVDLHTGMGEHLSQNRTVLF